MEENKKPLSEWTLGEVKAECGRIADDCLGCRFRVGNDCLIDSDTPNKWDLKEKSSWTEADVEDAKAIVRATGMKWVARDKNGSTYAYSDEPKWNGEIFFQRETISYLCDSILPSLRPGEKVHLEDIIHVAPGA